MNRKPKKSKDDSEDLYNELLAAKSGKKILKSELKSSISQSKIFIRKSQSQTNLPLLPSPKADNSTEPTHKVRKQQSLLQLSRSLHERIEVDKQAKVKINQIHEEYASKKRKLQKKIQQIRKRNMARMKQLTEFEQRYIKKMTAEYQKDKEVEQGLLEEYNFILRQEGKSKQTNAFRQVIQAEDWKQILREKQKLQAKIREYTRKQENLLREQNPEHLQKIKEEAEKKMLEEQKARIAISKQKSSNLPKVKGDAKAIGNEYLQYAKKIKQLPKQKSKLRMMDVNLKSIDYGSDIMNKIARNTSDLSRYRVYQQVALQTKTGNGTSKQKSGSAFKLAIPEIKEDEQTKKNLKQIRANLKELSKNKKK